MRRHESSFIVAATPEEVWSVLHPPAPVDLEPGGVEVREFNTVRIEILHQGDAVHDGLVRHCTYRVPKFLLTGGVAESWELLTDIEPGRSSHYRAITRPPFATAEGWTFLRDLGDGRTQITQIETYMIANRLLRAALERYLHAYISRDNDELARAGVEAGLRYLRSGQQP